jgi:hypothetical protein
MRKFLERTLPLLLSPAYLSLENPNLENVLQSRVTLGFGLTLRTGSGSLFPQSRIEKH